ncbi:hypothetical protein SAMN04487891_10320 [Flagellimonas taeanensis]|uniref:Lipoprotein n=1 Tax=Flagellimonas taeanensis TaxID=1005926 RepID=A0A1M6T1E4_9FLAO|nr:hypothetical protein [Allomuricauda taeanensis]SFB84678.1 hypothetical protein SAMN04487891_10320 [Allomuricauda taeanensis]SHK50720.1 hypothetical protein SAMN05216293_1181 [Allomuricauda taeanensis]
MKNRIILLIALVSILSCKNGQGQGPQPESEQLESLGANNTEENFSEGRIDVVIHFPGNRLSEILNKVDPSKGDVQQQMQNLMKDLSQAEAENIKKVMEANPILAMQIMFAPMLKNEIFVREDHALAKCDGLIYHLENKLDGDNDTGVVFIQSQHDKSNQLTFKYDKDYFGEIQLQTRIDMDMYDREQTNDTDVIADYTCTKAIYTLKNSTPMALGKLEVWTSGRMPQSLNFIHPFYLEEEHGIMKIAIYQDMDSDMPMMYEFKKVTPTPVSDSEMEIQQSQPVYSGKSDAQTIAAKLMGIMFGNP